MLKKITGLVLGLVLLASVALALNLVQRDRTEAGIGSTSPAVRDEARVADADYLRGAHWFGGAWAVNFWNTDLESRASEEFHKIQADGFNTVVLVVPWPGFAASAEHAQLQPQRARRLQSVIDLAGASGLNVVLRVGYAWDSSIPDTGRWLTRLWQEDSVYQAWLEHISALWELVKDREHVRFAFISWEDLWAVTGLGNGDLKQRRQMAGSTGFRSWLQEHSTLEAVSNRYGKDFERWAQVPIPSRFEPAFGLFYDFVDHAWVQRFFLPAQQRFPKLSMEVRIDSDPVWNAPDDLAYWHSHELAWDLPGAPWTTVYWSPAMGGENAGEILTPEVAAERLIYQMTRLRQVTGERPIFIDQFLVEDFTPGFENNGRLESEKVGEFLQAATPVLQSLTHGYALWGWQDYQHDAVPSPDFFQSDALWSGLTTDSVGAESITLPEGAQLQRRFARYEFHTPGGPEHAELCVQAVPDDAPDTDLSVRTDTLDNPLALDLSSGHACTTLPLRGATTVTLEALEDLSLKHISLYGFTQPIGIRTLAGDRKPIAEAWKTLNKSLVTASPAPFPAWEGGWMGKTLTPTARKSGASNPKTLSFTTGLPSSWPFEPMIDVRGDGVTLSQVPCRDGERQEIALQGQRPSAFSLTVDRTYRPEGEQRRLGCRILDFEIR